MTTEIWEMIESHRDGDTYRMEIPGGWLYRVREYGAKDSPIAIAVKFVPMPPTFVPETPGPNRIDQA